jgi:hypothetical protein
MTATESVAALDGLQLYGRRVSMRHVSCVAVLVLFASCSHAKLSPSPTTAVNAELLALETALDEGVMHHDRAGLERILAAEFGLSLPGRPAAARADWLNNVERMTLDGYKITNPSVSVWGDVAVVRTRQLFENSRTAGVPRPPGNDITDLWTRRDGRWQLVRRLSDVLHQP